MAAAAPEPARVFRFGPFDADLRNRQLFRNGVSVGLTGQPFEVLALLLEHPGQLVTREELRARLWPSGTVVEFDHGISTAITKLREVLGDEAQHPRFIATVPRHGYRFIAPVAIPAQAALEVDRASASPVAVPMSTREVRPARQITYRIAIAVLAAGLVFIALHELWMSKHVPASRPMTPTATVPETEAIVRVSERSIAVLPFTDMSEKKDQEYFGDGLAEELLDLLSKTPGLHVIARTSSFSFKGKSDDIPTIAAKLKVANILEGSVRKSANRLRISTQLIRAADGEHLWAETYDRELKDVFKVQDEIANAVVAALALRLGGGLPFAKPHGTSNLQAYDEFLECREFYKRGGLENQRRASEACSKAIEFDPKYAAAYAQLAITEAFTADLTGDVDKLRRAFETADKAVVLGPDQAISYAARGFLRLNFNFDWQGAQSDISRALAISPNDSWVLIRYARLLTSLGRYSDAIDANKKALEIDPLLPHAWEGLAYDYQALRNLPAALEASRREVAISPDNPYALYRLALTLLLQGKGNEALARFSQMKGTEPLALCGIAMAEFTLGHEAKSRAALNHLIDQHADKAPYQVAMVYAWRGDKDQAFEWLERARQRHDGGLSEVKCDPILESLRSDAPYKALLRKMNLPE